MGEGWVIVSDVGLLGSKMILRALSENGYPELAYGHPDSPHIPPDSTASPLRTSLPIGESGRGGNA